MKPTSSFTATICSDILDAFRCLAREASKSGAERKDAESVKQRWLTVESFTALLIEACGRNIIDNDMLISLAFDQRIYERLNVGSPKSSYNSIPRNHGPLFLASL